MDNTNYTLKITKVRDVKTPERGTPYSAGLDFFIPNDFNNGEPYELKKHMDVLIKSGIRAALPPGVMLMAADKSGIATSKHALIGAGMEWKWSNPDAPLKVGAKIVDEDYQGEIGLHIVNIGNRSVNLVPGQKLVQFIMVPVIYCDVEEYSTPEEIFPEPTERGEGGWGSTNETEPTE